MGMTRTTQVERNCLTKIRFFVVEANKDFYIPLINLLIYWFHNKKKILWNPPPPTPHLSVWLLQKMNSLPRKC